MAQTGWIESFYRYFRLILLYWLLPATKLGAQDAVGLWFVTGTVHPYGENMAFLMPARVNDRATLVFNWGFVGTYQRYFYKKRWSLKFAQGVYSDCAQLFAGHTHLGFRLNVLNGRKHSLEVGFGPTFVYRRSWYRFPGYVQDANLLLKTSGEWQWNFVWYGGEINYIYHLTRQWDLTCHVIPGPPKFFTFGFGTRYWLQYNPPNREWPKGSKIHFRP
ncbi:MAG TPA: hypothetical protein PLO67_15535 [Saprospiraceae bacterium]|nr:hypothetical protein [Saprospiraceae bacterium]HPI04938.1 hypothetical protein [Saprospiraceae bacterium]